MTFQLSLLYTTFDTQENAERVSRNLLERQLIACANILREMVSLYVWEGQMEERKEIAVLFKTTTEKIPELMSALQDLHPYETPAMLEVALERTNEPFANWVKNCIR